MKTSIYTILGIIGIVLVVILGMALTSVTGVLPNSDNQEITAALDTYLPLEPSIWTYTNGEAYRKIMATEQVYESEKFKHIIVKGEEGDESIRSFNETYVFEYTYKIENEQLTRHLEGNVILDGYSDVILLKSPIKVGTKWQDKWTTLKGEVYSVTSEITSIEEDGQLIVVQSTAKDLFVVERTIKSGKGVISFKIVEEYDDIDFETGYQLFTFEAFDYDGFDQYMAFLGNEKIGTSKENIEEISENPTSVKNQLNQENEETESSEDVEIQENDEIEESERLAIQESIQLFNDKWILFINEGDMSIMETITPNASVKQIIDAYMDKVMTQKFLEMSFDRIVLRGNVANAYVYEEIERTMDGKTEVLVYNWIYEVDKIDGKWLVEGYIENKNP